MPQNSRKDSHRSLISIEAVARISGRSADAVRSANPPLAKADAGEILVTEPNVVLIPPPVTDEISLGTDEEHEIVLPSAHLTVRLKILDPQGDPLQGVSFSLRFPWSRFPVGSDVIPGDGVIEFRVPVCNPVRVPEAEIRIETTPPQVLDLQWDLEATESKSPEIAAEAIRQRLANLGYDQHVQSEMCDTPHELGLALLAHDRGEDSPNVRILPRYAGI